MNVATLELSEYPTFQLLRLWLESFSDHSYSIQAVECERPSRSLPRSDVPSEFTLVRHRLPTPRGRTVVMTVRHQSVYVALLLLAPDLSAQATTLRYTDRQLMGSTGLSCSSLQKALGGLQAARFLRRGRKLSDGREVEVFRSAGRSFEGKPHILAVAERRRPISQRSTPERLHKAMSTCFQGDRNRPTADHVHQFLCIMVDRVKGVKSLQDEVIAAELKRVWEVLRRNGVSQVALEWLFASRKGEWRDELATAPDPAACFRSIMPLAQRGVSNALRRGAYKRWMETLSPEEEQEKQAILEQLRMARS